MMGAMTTLLRSPRRALWLLLALVAPVPALAQQATDAVAPEAHSGHADKAAVSAKRWMIAAANPLAAAAGAAMLRAGGDAVDATIAAQLVLGLVEPQSSGLGGGAFVVHWDAAARRLTTLDGRETAPLAATPELFLDGKGEPMPFPDAVVGGRSVGTPGTPRLLETLHRRFGRLPWPRLFDPAIRLADAGFAVSPRLARLIAGEAATLKRHPATAAYFLTPDGAPLAAGTVLTNPDYAATLRALAAGGADAFYAGPIAEDVVATVREAASNPGLLSLDDLALYRVKERPAVCGAYRAYEVCGMGPPSSGGIAVAEILGLLAPYDLAALGPASPQAWRLVADASRLAFADRERFVADPDFVPVPAKGLLEPGYLKARAEFLNGSTALSTVAPGEPKWSHARALSDGDAPEIPSTSHLVVVDADGDVVSMTTTIEAGFGSRLMVRGFLLNNELTDFSFRTHKDGVPVANRVEPMKRPRSSMAPTIVMKDGRPVLALGSPGGSQIIGYVVKTLVAHLDWQMDLAAAIAAPNVLSRFGPVEIEAGTAATTMKPALEAMGFAVKEMEMSSGVQAIAIGPDGLVGAADPRREGVAVGE